ncbi:MAG: hypothetical protein CMJ06_04250 [Pelagibacterales bacterium]|nr:hypothetical protein [Pelagibacterales bacterium]OUU62061.1 MAG: hypothetical protein CBC22_05700 [Alphaproteobacteria bacterium TMED62]
MVNQNQNICVVGDDDQSIYSWRGAEVRNIFKFEKEYKDVKVIKLEKNYRSKANILNAANFLISKNKNRMGKNLWTDDEPGNKIEIININNSEEEAIYISDKIEEIQSLGISLENFAILVRASYQTRAFEDRFIKIGLPYKIIGGTKFYERLEIKDALAFLRVVSSDYDDLAFERIINVPKKGIGEKTIRDIEIFGRKKNFSLMLATRELVKINYFTKKVNNNLINFLNFIDKCREQKSLSAAELTETILDESGYTEMWQKNKSVEAETRLDNLKELVTAISEFDNIRSFIEHIQLVMDNEINNKNNSVNILTFHAAKGLEFENIFLPGWEEEVFPNKRALEERLNNGLEEERRLAYVGITRAKDRVWILHANSRIIHGQWFYSIPSRFLSELPPDTILLNNLVNLNTNYINNLDNTENLLEHDNSFLNKKNEKNIIVKGNKVFHQKFGYGFVINIENDNAEVNFEKTSTKKVKIDYLSKDV